MKITRTPKGSPDPFGSKLVLLRLRYRFLSALQAPVAWLFWLIRQRLDRLELQLLRLRNHYQERNDDY